MVENTGFFGSIFGGNKKEEATTIVADVDGNQEKAPERKFQREVLEISQPIIDNARLTLLEILRTMQLDVDVVAHEPRNNAISLEVTGGEDLGLVIGKEGNTLRSLQFLLSNILSRKYEKRAYVYLDANNYKSKQEQIIIAAANDAADVAEAEGVQIVLDPMTAAERLVVHTILQDREAIETFSRGEGRSRQVVISPKGFNKN